MSAAWADRPIAAITAYCEGSSASPFERRCIIHSIFNRVVDGRFGRTVAGVCLKRFQYSEFNDDAVNNANLERGATASPTDPIMLDCASAFDEVQAGAPDPTAGATHYHEKAMAVYPSWTKKQPNGRQAVVALTTDRFIFYSHVP